ncbi:hypothetical protein [Sulfitobacter sp. THAF37]|uniref:hypothetical protein n=1 Tax=Sulfitobacter sp. THAF37 TaxID=2587855 RepID=UPI001267AF8C|nr:hypothetical protein [Sulfitobacter sp. THAF37]
MNIEEVPTAIRRRAAQLLETVRGTEMDPTGGKARLSPQVTALFRPDMDDVAYYEFAVDLGRGDDRLTAITGRGDRDGKMGMPAGTGFIIAASKGHDHPIAHWSLDREPPSRQIAIAAEEKGSRVARVFKVDSLSYVGETEDGEMAGQTGQLPLPIEGLPEDFEKARGRISSTLVRPAQKPKDDTDPGNSKPETVNRGARPQRVKLREVESWAQLRKVYAKAFGPLLGNLARNAAPAWEIEDLVAKMGEGVMTGSTHRVALLESDAAVEISGEGARLVKIEPLDTPEGSGAVALHVADEKLAHEVSFEMHISYRSGLRETLLFFAVSETTPSDRKPDSGMNFFEE